MNGDTENPAPSGEPERTTDEAQVSQSAPRQVAPRLPMRAGAHPMAIVPRTYEEAWRIATHYIASGLAARDVKSAERAQLVIMAGLEVGLPPVAAFNNIAIINNRPRIWGAAVPGLAINTGQLATWEEEVTGEGDAMVARCKVSRRLSSDVLLTREITFSVEEAKRAGLWETEAKVDRWVWKTDGSKGKERKVVDNDSPWYRYPKRMLLMRARQAFTDLFSDAYSGLGVAEVYVSPGTDAEMRDVTPPTVTDDHVDNPLGGDDEAAEPLTTGTVILDGTKGYPAGTVISPTPEEVADAPKPKRATKPRAEPKDAPAATAGAGQAIQGGYTAPEGDGDRPEPRATGSGVIPASAKTVPTHPDAMKVPPQATLIRWGGAEYVEYISTWCRHAVAYAAGTEGFLLETYIRDRHKKEMGARNDLGTKLTDEERERMNVICRAASKGQEF